MTKDKAKKTIKINKKKVGSKSYLQLPKHVSIKHVLRYSWFFEGVNAKMSMRFSYTPKICNGCIMN